MRLMGFSWASTMHLAVLKALYTPLPFLSQSRSPVFWFLRGLGRIRLPSFPPTCRQKASWVLKEYLKAFFPS